MWPGSTGEPAPPTSWQRSGRNAATGWCRSAATSSAARKPAGCRCRPEAELQWWYQYYFATERGQAGYEKYRREFAKLIWRTASPQWSFDDATFERSAASFDNPDHVAIVIHNYRWRLGLADGEPEYAALEQQLAAGPAIAVPTITLEGDANGAPHPEPDAYAGRFSGPYTHRTIEGGIGHNLPQEAPQAFADAVLDVGGWNLSLFSNLRSSGSLPVEGHLPGFGGATGWLNSPPLTDADVQGKVVLADFWTYTCINWLRTLAYVRAWAERYADQGLVVVGVHTPEFPFERDIDNVRRAAKDMRVDYPIALDSDYAIWQAFANHYWPAVYIADAEGRIRHHHFGEGGYAECEMVIQRLLREAGRDGVPDDVVSVAPEGFEAQADWTNLESPESYLGYEQGRSFGSPERADARRASDLHGAGHAQAQPVGARRRVDDRTACLRAQRP